MDKQEINTSTLETPTILPAQPDAVLSLEPA